MTARFIEHGDPGPGWLLITDRATGREIVIGSKDGKPACRRVLAALNLAESQNEKFQIEPLA